MYVDMSKCSDEFVLGQMRYYDSIRGVSSRVCRESGTIGQLYSDFRCEAKRRGLIDD